jgi:hypothetical protein
MNQLLVIAFCVIMLSDVLLTADKLSAAFCIVMLSVFMLFVIMLSVMAPV